MKLLVIGGTVFVGRHIVESGLAKGHEIAVMHRGKSACPKDWNVREILADRDGGLSTLGDEKWDAVIDCVGYVPRLVGDSAKYLEKLAHRYLFISTISVYSEGANGSPTVFFDKPKVETESVTYETYGPLKVECEQEVEKYFKGRCMQVRPGIVAGAYDPTNRLTYWADRFGRYDEVLVPELRDCPFQVIDARDLGEFCIHLLETDQTGIFNACGETVLLGELIKACQLLGKAKPVWVSIAELQEAGVNIPQAFPLCNLPEDFDSVFRRVKTDESMAAGLKLRPFAETLQYTMDWSLGCEDGPPEGKTRTGSSGMSREEEEELFTKISKVNA